MNAGRRRDWGFSTLEVLISLMLIVLVVVFTWRTIGATLALLGSGNRDYQKAARLRTQTTGWIQAVTEYTRQVGFTAVPIGSFWIPQTLSSATPPYNGGPALPVGFQCGHVIIADWDGGGPVNPADLRLVTVEVYRVRPTCSDSAPPGTPYLSARTGIANRE